MNFFHVIILSIVEGVTEFLPISSTAHLILTSHLLGIRPSEFLSTFEISIQLGAIAAVCLIYAKKVINNKQLFYKACVGFIPTGILGLLFFKHIKLLLNSSLVPIIALFIGGIAIIGIELYFKRNSKFKIQNSKFKNLENLTYKDALLIGLIQSISMIPGVSRAAASIFGAMALKFDRQSAVEFAFLLAIPTMSAATGLDLIKSAPVFSTGELYLLLLGTMGSFLVALIAVRWLIKYVQNNNFIMFGIYRIVLSILYFLLFLK